MHQKNLFIKILPRLIIAFFLIFNQTLSSSANEKAFFIGHSLVDGSLIYLFKHITNHFEGQKINQVDKIVRPGSPLSYHWDHSIPPNPPSYYLLPASTGAYDGQFNNADYIIMTESSPLSNAIEVNRPTHHAGIFNLLASFGGVNNLKYQLNNVPLHLLNPSNLKVKTYLYSSWPSFKTGDGTPPAPNGSYPTGKFHPMSFHERVACEHVWYHTFAKRINDVGPYRFPGQKEMKVIPVAYAISNLIKAGEQNQLPGLSNNPQAPNYFMKLFFKDDIHFSNGFLIDPSYLIDPNHAGSYFIALVLYASLFNKSPVGAPTVGLATDPWGTPYNFGATFPVGAPALFTHPGAIHLNLSSLDQANLAKKIQEIARDTALNGGPALTPLGQLSQLCKSLPIDQLDTLPVLINYLSEI
jgi:hypothetical protein